jgi:hypothetical protein
MYVENIKVQYKHNLPLRKMYVTQVLIPYYETLCLWSSKEFDNIFSLGINSH